MVRGVLSSALLRDPGLLTAKIVVDCNNTDMTSDARPIDPNPGGLTLVELLAADIPGARVVKAFTSVPHRVLELER
jgi:predicted dinucleotide-binding enzyme